MHYKKNIKMHLQPRCPHIWRSWERWPRNAPALRRHQRIHDVTLRNKVCSCEIRKALKVELLLRIERFQLRCFGHLSRMLREWVTRQVLPGTPTGKRPRSRPRTWWSDYTSDLAWSHLGVEPAEPSEISVDRGVSRYLLGLLSPRPST